MGESGGTAGAGGWAAGTVIGRIGDAQWVGHILKQLHLISGTRRKHHVGGTLYAIERREVLDMMQRYDVPPIEMEPRNNRSKWSKWSTSQPP